MISEASKKDILILLEPNFADPAYSGERFYCWHCALIEGVLVGSPQLAKNLEIHRVPWPRPRQSVIALIGEQNQSLPVLILASETETLVKVEKFEGVSFISDKDKILQALSERHGFPKPHP